MCTTKDFVMPQSIVPLKLKISRINDNPDDGPDRCGQFPTHPMGFVSCVRSRNGGMSTTTASRRCGRARQRKSCPAMLLARFARCKHPAVLRRESVHCPRHTYHWCLLEP